MNSDELATLATEAFVYGFALVFDLTEVDRFTRNGLGGAPATPFNSGTRHRWPGTTSNSSRSTTTRCTRSRSSI